MYLKDFEIRWSDLDANRHTANSTFADLCTETRVSHLRENGFSQSDFARGNFGPVIFSEEFYYLKEIMPGENIRISLELLANTADYRYIKFAHCVFNHAGKLSVYSETFFGWFDLAERKLILPPAKIVEILSGLSHADNYGVLPDNYSLKNPKVPSGKNIS
jgi:acyl-CoA thioester hydrolase